MYKDKKVIILVILFIGGIFLLSKLNFKPFIMEKTISGKDIYNDLKLDSCYKIYIKEIEKEVDTDNEEEFPFIVNKNKKLIKKITNLIKDTSSSSIEIKKHYSGLLNETTHYFQFNVENHSDIQARYLKEDNKLFITGDEFSNEIIKESFPSKIVVINVTDDFKKTTKKLMLKD